MSETDRHAPRPPILLLHGIFSKPAFLLPWVERLDAAGFDCHAPALPGREPTDEALLARSGVAEYYEAALAAYDALERPSIVIGHSLGGLLGQKLAAARPCAALVLLASVPPGILWAQPVAMQHLARLLPAIVKGRAVLPSAETLRAIPLHGLPRQEQDEVIAEMVPDSGRAFRDLTMGAPATRVDAAAVDCPVLCVSAGADRNVSARASAAIAKRYDAPHSVHPGLPHWIIAASALERVAPPVLDWLGERFPGLMDLSGLVKSLELPPGFEAPRRLTFEDIEARAISRADLADDVAGINASLDLIARTRGGGWPTDPVTEEENFTDIVWHELEFREGTSFAFVVRDRGGGYLGCCYLYPLGRRTELSEPLLAYDVDVSWWVTPDAYGRGRYAQLYTALGRWVRDPYPFSAPFYSNQEVPEIIGNAINAEEGSRQRKESS